MEGEIRTIEDFAAEKDRIYESRRESLRREIGSLRSFLLSMAKDQELIRRQAQAELTRHQKRLSNTERELRDTQCRLKETQNEAASLLESKHTEMVELQKERDSAFRMLDSLCRESTFLKDYGKSLEQKICTLETKLHEYHHELGKKSEAVFDAEPCPCGQWEYLQQNMMKLERNLLELQSTNVQLSLEKEYYVKELHNLKQSLDKSDAGLEDAEKKLKFATYVIEDMEERIRMLESDFQNANQRTESLSSQLNEADATIWQLQGQVQKLKGQLDALQEKHLLMLKEKLEADAAAKSREAAISVLMHRVSAIEDDIQKERFLGVNKLPDARLGCISEFSPALEISERTRIEASEGASGSDYIERNIETMENSSYEEEVDQSNCDVGIQTDETIYNPWNIRKIEKLEHTLTETHRQYRLLSEEQIANARASGSNVAEDEPNMDLQAINSQKCMVILKLDEVRRICVSVMKILQALRLRP